MLLSQRLTQQRAVIQNKLNNDRLLEIRSTDPDAEARGKERKALTEELRINNNEYIAALDAEERETEGAEFSAEPMELRQLVHRAEGEFGQAFDRMVNHRNVDGAFAELQGHYGLPQHLIPVRLLQEQRASVTGLTDEPSAAQAMRPYIFPRSVASFMGFDMPTVPYGTPAFPVVTTPVTVHSPAAGADAAETTGVIGADALSPGRRQGSLRYNREQAAAFPQLAEGVRAHVQAAFASAIDQLALDGTAGLGSISDPGDPGSQTTFDQYVAAFSPDGRYSATLAEINCIVGSSTLAHMRGRYRAATAPNSAYQTLAGDGLQLRVASGIAAPASNDQAAYSVKGPTLGHGVIPVWDGVELVVDPYSSSVAGELTVTIVGMAAIKMLRTDAWTRHHFQLA